MSKKSDIENELAKLNKKLQILNSAPNDTYPFGTVVVFSAVEEWYYVKIGEESWKKLGKSNLNEELSLAEWILNSVEADVGYFEVYVMITDEDPIYSSPA